MNTAVVAALPPRAIPAAGRWLLCGIVLAALTEASAGTLLVLGRADVIGDMHATPDEAAWIDIAYQVAKLLGFLMAPWVLGRLGARRALVGATLAMGVACGLAALTPPLDALIALRLAQGFAGGLLLVAGQAIVFLAYPAAHQPALQALFAIGAVVAPATLVPALHGWMLDAADWTTIMATIVPVALAGAGALLLDDAPLPAMPRRPFDAVGTALAAVAVAGLVYALVQGVRWDGFGAAHVRVATGLGSLALMAFLVQQRRAAGRGLLDWSLFGVADFAFAFVVSFVAGAALFGSAFLIPAFAVSVLGFTPTSAGCLLLPSGVLFVATLLGAAWAMQARRLPPVATVPVGIALIMAAMWLLSGANAQSGADLQPAIALRGIGLGLLFLSITLIAFGALAPGQLAAGIGLFNAGRQLGGLVGVAALQALIERDVALNLTVLGANVSAAMPAVAGRLSATIDVLVSRGLDPAVASRTATAWLGRALHDQARVLAFDAAFASVAVLFVVAVPVIVATRRVLARRARRT